MQPTILVLERAGGEPVATPFRPAGLGADDPFAAGREIAWSGGSDAVAAGRVAWSGTLSGAALPHTEMLVVHAGELRLSAGSESLVLRPGEGVVVGRGTVLDAGATPGTRWAFCAVSGQAPAGPGLWTLSAAAPLSPSAAPAAELLIGPAPDCRSFNAYTEEATRFRAGTWDSTPYRRILRPHPVSELMHLLEGSVDLPGPDGEVTRVARGDSIFVAQGARCGWESREHVAKFYVVQQAGA